MDILDKVIAHLIKRNRELLATAQRLQTKVQDAANKAMEDERQRQRWEALEERKSANDD
ncbi:MAG TPA: hypothetical protein VFL96_07630 [Acidobacteriaceae bacterium]|jgi:hypothetical protein|nr:hypothetical protein [Acidobacteriaceae bacterium]